MPDGSGPPPTPSGPLPSEAHSWPSCSFAGPWEPDFRPDRPPRCHRISSQSPPPVHRRCGIWRPARPAETSSRRSYARPGTASQTPKPSIKRLRLASKPFPAQGHRLSPPERFSWPFRYLPALPCLTRWPENSPLQLPTRVTRQPADHPRNRSAGHSVRAASPFGFGPPENSRRARADWPPSPVVAAAGERVAEPPLEFQSAD